MEKIFDKTQFFMIKVLNKLALEGNYFNKIQVMYERPPASILFIVKRLKTFVPRSATR